MELKRLLKKNKKSFIIYIIGAFLTTPSNILMTLALANSFSLLDATNKIEITKIIIVTVLLAFLPVIFQIVSRYMRMGFMKDVLTDVRIMSYEKLMATKVDTFSKTSIESYESKLISDINLFEQEFFISLLNIIFTGGSYVLSMIILYAISYQLATLTLLATVGIYLITLIYEKSILKSKEKVIQENMYYQKSLTNILNGLETIKLYQATDRFLKVFKVDINKYEKVKADDFGKNQQLSNLISAVAFFMQSIAFIYAGYLFTKGNIAINMMVVALSIVGTLVWTIHNGMERVNRFKSSILIYDDLVKYTKEEDAGVEFSFKDKLVIENLNYAYNSKPVLKNLNLKIKANSKVLIYGESGSGKTTFINTITKNIEGYSGKISYDGVDLKDISYHSFSDHVGYVRQEHFLFDDTIKNNIILSKDFNQEKFDRVIEQSGLTKYIESLDDHENHLLCDNGSNISGGQRQRINIARELYQDKEILIFDEPSASLDDYNASVIYETMMTLNKTVIVISHRHLEFLQNRVDQQIDLSKEVKHG